MNKEQARSNMIKQQIRPWNVLDEDTLNLLSIVKRECFVPENVRSLAFVDTELALPCGQNMLAPKVEARLLQALAIRPHEQALEIGAGSGYMSALLAYRARHVTSIEIFPELVALARNNLSKNGILNADVVQGNGAINGSGHYDVICISGGLGVLPQKLLSHLNIHGRLIAFIGQAPIMQAQLITHVSHGNYTTTTLFETCVTPLVDTEQSSHFSF